MAIAGMARVRLPSAVRAVDARNREILPLAGLLPFVGGMAGTALNRRPLRNCPLDTRARLKPR
jgi:hypothetical protein